MRFTNRFYDDKNKKDEIGGVCSPDGRGEKCLQNFVWNPEWKRHKRNGKISEWILEKQGGELWTGFIWLRIETNDGC